MTQKFCGKKARQLTAAFIASVMLAGGVPVLYPDSDAKAQENVQEEAGTVQTQSDNTELLPYQDTSLSFEERAADLVARMTLEEKAAQTAAKNAPAIDRLGVHSYYYWREGIHGVARQGVATSFPSSLAMSNTWDRQLMYEVMDITSTEARGKNNRYDLNYWNPTINMARDPRWGRNEESYGEDPYLTAEMGGNAVKGMQGTDDKYIKTITTLKHYAANNCEGERQTGTSVANESTMREYYLRAFRDITENYDPGAVMSSYNGTTIYRDGEILSSSTGQKIDYVASSANSYLINDVLRRTYGFDGFVVGDCGAWDNAFGRQPLRQKLYLDMKLDDITAPMTVAKIIAAGSSLDCNSGANGTGQVAAAVQQGLISEDMLDIAVYELFLQRMRTGEFDEGAKYQDIDSSVIETDEHVQKAEEAAEKSWVLLENDGTLPLKGEKADDAIKYENGTVTVSADAESGELVIASYDNGALKSVETEPLTFTNGTASVEKSGIENGSKLMVWNSMSDMEPLCEPKIVDGETSGDDSENSAMTIAVVGSHADEVVLGDYSGEPTKLTTPMEGITNAVKKISPDSTVELIGNVGDTTPLFNIKSITLVKSTGKNTKLDLSSATKVNGMEKSGAELINITKSGVACIEDVDFKDVTDIKIEAASLPGMPNVNVSICYESLSQPAANVTISPTSGADDYAENTGVYNGATGGYTGVADMYIQINANSEFSVENYKASLDKADYIIAYGGTTTADSSESNDRASIDLPQSENHVEQICEAYPDKTIVALQTVGQVNVENIKDKCAALLWTSYNGQTQGEALGKILTGEVNPSGKLSTTWYTKADLDKMPIGSQRQKIDGIDYNFTNYELSGDINNENADYPGRTYQYYTGTPVYEFGYGSSYTSFEYSNIAIDKTNADANDIVTITADVTNTGKVSGAEVAQLYISVPGAGENGLPIKQLKGFERVELAPGETKTVTFKVDISDVFFFDEQTQKNYVVNGEYTAVVGGSSADESAQQLKFNVSGSIAETLKNVYTIPSGLKVYGARVGNEVKPAIGINAGTSVTLKDDSVITDFAANGITVTYESANANIASVDENGNVSAGTQEGTTTITVTARKGGSTVITSFPVVTQFKDGMTEEERSSYLKRLDDTYSSCPEAAYTAENWARVKAAYDNAYAEVSTALLNDGLELLVKNAVAEMLSVPKIELTDEYTIQSENANIIKDNRIEYSEEGIGTYTAEETTITGTVTADAPAEIAMQAMSGGSEVDGELIWTVERLDGSSRKNAEIDAYSGIMKLYENGVYRITASDYANRKSGSIVVYANLQIEGESADDGGGADLADEKTGASGGRNAGSTEDYWLRFDGIKLSRLKEITFRTSQKDAESTVNVSLMPNSDWIIASAEVPKTGAWTNWAQTTAGVNRYELDKLTLDENGCGTIYIQTNESNLDYIQLIYDNSDIDAYCLANGSIGVNVSAQSGTLVAEVGGSVRTSTEITGAGNYKLSGFEEGDEITLKVMDGESQAGEAVSLTYTPAKVKDITVYNFSDSVFDSFFDSAEGTALSSGIGMDGFGGWNTDKGGSYTYGGRTYTFTRSLKGGNGTDNARKVYFTPDADGVVTALFNANSTRCMYIEQGANKVEKYGNGAICEIQLNVTAGEPVYVYGGGSNKNLYAVIFEANKSAAEATPTPSPSPTPTAVPVPDTDYSAKIEFEQYTKAWAGGMREGSNTNASGGKMIENTSDGDIFYFGEYSMDDMLVVTVTAGMRDNDGAEGVGSAEVYAVDVSGIDVNNADKNTISALLTDENKLGSTNITGTRGDWNNYLDNNIVLSSKYTGEKGIFVKLGATVRYAGNYDYITLKYNLGQSADTAALYSDALTAENETTYLSVSGDDITAVNKSDDTISSVSAKEIFGNSVTFKKLINNRGMFTALITDESGETKLVTSPMGTVWIDATPDYYAQADPDAPETVNINDFCVVGDQIYLGCDGGWLITMTSCAKCTAIKKVCDFDIKAVDYADGKLELSDGENSEEIDIADARQYNIKYDAAMELVNNGAVLVDVRTPEEFAEGTLDGAVNVELDDFEEWLEGQSDDTVVIVFCASGARSAAAVEKAKALDHDMIYDLDLEDGLISAQ